MPGLDTKRTLCLYINHGRLDTICWFTILTLPSSFQTALWKENLSLEFHTSAATKISGGYVTQKEDVLFK